MSLNHVIEGQGEPIVLLHGLFGSLENLGVVARQLQERFKVVCIDLPDHGNSLHTQEFSYDVYAGLVRETLQMLGLHRVNILGHSMGGKVAMKLSLEHPEMISSLVVADISPVHYPPRHANVFKALTSFDPKQIKSRSEADKAMSAFVSEAGVRQFLLKSLKKDNDEFKWQFNLDVLMRDYEALSGGIDSHAQFSGKTLFIKGANSDYITIQHQEKIRKLFPNAQAKIVDGTGHWLHAEKPFVFAGIVERFLLDED